MPGGGALEDPQREASRRLRIARTKRAQWATMTAEDRRAFGRKVSEGHARRRARGEGYKPYALWQRQGGQ